MEIITVIQKIRKRNLWLVRITIKLRFVISIIAVFLGFLGVLWAILGTAGDGGGWGRGTWPEFINSTGKEWKVWFGDRIAKIAIMMWFGTFAEIAISMRMWNMLKNIEFTLGLGLNENIDYSQANIKDKGKDEKENSKVKND